MSLSSIYVTSGRTQRLNCGMDKKMREKWKRAVLLLGCMALVFSGCGKTGDVKESGAVEPVNEDAQKFWYMY